MKNKKVLLSLLSSCVLLLTGCNGSGGRKVIIDKEAIQANCKHEYKYINSPSDNRHFGECIHCKYQTGLMTHVFKKDDSKESLNVEFTCTERGYIWEKCTCGEERTTETPALGHSLDIITVKENTCTKDGLDRYVCKRSGCEYIREVVTKANGHSYNEVWTLRDNNYATLKCESCASAKCGSTRIRWNPTEVTQYCKDYELYFFKPYEDGGGQGFNEYAYEEYSNAVQFYGRPIHNHAAIKDEKPNYYVSVDPIYDEDIPGSFFEYKFYLKSSFNDCNLIADIEPSKNMPNGSKVFSNVDGDTTVGLKKVVENGNETIVQYKNRYVVTIDGEEIDQDLTLECNELASSGRKWYTFPLVKKLNLGVGEHTIRISMAGGYRAMFYGFALENFK